jgi:hypothetical protein
MTKSRVTSLQKRAANRANARKSSGPKSDPGKSRSSLNSVKHSLTRPIDGLPWGDHLCTLAKLLEQEGFSSDDAIDLARKILDYERNVDYQRTRFLDFKAGAPLHYETPPSVHADMLVAARLDQSKKETGKSKPKPKPAPSNSPTPIFDEKLDVEIAKFFRQIAYRDLKAEHDKALRVLRNADRHLRRSANQLFKGLTEPRPGG